jgi:Asp/Glu/hydantoin racemase
MPKVAILHTSFVFVTVDPVFQELFAELMPDVEVIDFVDSDVLARVRKDGGITPSSTERMRHMALAAEAAGVDLIFSACSSLGPALDEARRSVHVPIVKVDEAMAEQAVLAGSRIGVLATVPTTLRPTSDLVHAAAAPLGRQVETTERLCEGAFDLLMGGDRAAHDAEVLRGAQDLAQTCDVIVLAQASMARLAPMLSARTGKPVLASPRTGVEDVRRRLSELDGTDAAVASAAPATKGSPR